MNIFVLATASHSSGALTIYRQFLKHLPENNSNDIFYLFVEESMDKPIIGNVHYVSLTKQSWRQRIIWSFFGLNKWAKANHIFPDLVISLQNIGIRTKVPQLIYYHQPLPLFERKWSPFNKKEFKYFLYKNFYLLFVKLTKNQKTHYITQINFITERLSKKLHLTKEQVTTLFPDTPPPPADLLNIKGYNPNSFIYPATNIPYKEHKTLIKAINLVKNQRPDLINKLSIKLTLSKEDSQNLIEEMKENKVLNNFIFIGKVPHNNLLQIYAESNALLFPSTIETLGLPLLEAASLGKRILASDLEYSHQVLETYAGAHYIPPYDYQSWANQIIKAIENPITYSPATIKKSSWPLFFKIAKLITNQSNKR